jgi:hypothetical protein
VPKQLCPLQSGKGKVFGMTLVSVVTCKTEFCKPSKLNSMKKPSHPRGGFLNAI